MANIAQIVNVLQSMILMRGDKMVLTPTYYVFEMYRPHQDATFLPLDIDTPTRTVRDDRVVPVVDATASCDADGRIHLSLVNIDIDKAQKVRISLDEVKPTRVSGTILTSKKIIDLNTFEKPNCVKPESFKNAKIAGGAIEVTLPAHAIVALEIE